MFVVDTRGRRARSSSVDRGPGGSQRRSASRARRSRSSSVDSWETRSNSSGWSEESSVWGSVTLTRSRPRSSSVDRSTSGIGRKRETKKNKQKNQNRRKKDQVFTVTLAAHVDAMSLNSNTSSSVASSATSGSRSARNRRRKARRRQKRQQRGTSSESSTGFSSTMFMDERLSELANMGLILDDGSEALKMLAACHDDKELVARRLALGDSAETSEDLEDQTLVEMEILVDGQPLATRTASAECCRAHMCGGDDHLWTYALIPTGDEAKPFSVRVRNHTAMQLAVELTVDNEMMARNWAVGPHKTKERLGQNTRYFACYTFQFDAARFVSLKGDSIQREPAEDDVLATIEEEDEEAEEAEPDDTVADARTAESTGSATAATAVVANRLTAAQFDASFVRDVDESNGGQETAKQMNTPGLTQLHDTNDFKRFKAALPGAFVRTPSCAGHGFRRKSKTPCHSLMYNC
jgi:hypothetical protein